MLAEPTLELLALLGREWQYLRLIDDAISQILR
jgi:hypothetical protein